MELSRVSIAAVDGMMPAVLCCPTQGGLFFGGADPFISPGRVQQIERRFRELKKDYQIKT